MAAADELQEWYYATDGVQAGPVTFAELSDAVRAGRIKQKDLVWREGMADWQPASSVPGLVETPAASNAYEAAPMPAVSPVQQPYVLPSPYAADPRAAQQLGYARPIHPSGQSYNGMAIGAFVCSLVAVPMTCVYCLGVPVSIVGLVLGIIAKNNMDRTGNHEGRGLAVASIIISSISLVLIGGLVIVGIIAGALGK